MSFITVIQSSKTAKIVAISLAVLLLIGIGILVYILVKRNSNPTNNNLSTETIRDLFNSTSTPPSFPPAFSPPAPPALSPTPASPSFETPNPTPVTPPAPIFQTYKHASLGFELELPLVWQTGQASDGSPFYINNRNQTINFQVYPAPTEGLNLVKEQLQKSPSVTQVKETNFKSLPAVSFTTDAGQDSLAFINNNHLYYIFGANFVDPNAFSFLN